MKLSNFILLFYIVLITSEFVIASSITLRETSKPPEFSCSVGKDQSGSSFEPGQKWTNGIVPYVIDESFTSEDLNQLSIAIDVYHRKTCIRFVPKTSTDIDYISIEYDPNTCGDAEVCRKGGKQFVRIGGACRTARVLVHELGHALCLQHEETRPDRDSYLAFHGCPPPALKPNSDTLGMLYDYKSVMHGSCGDMCMMPKMGGVSSSMCGGDFSVLDAEKINAFYGCGGCLGFRFRPADRLTDEERRDRYPLGTNLAGETLYLCRAYHNGDIIPGTLDGDSCVVPSNGDVFEYTGSGVEVFTLPGFGLGENTRRNQGSYTWQQISSDGTTALSAIPPSAVHGGREANGATTYIGLCELRKDGKMSTVIGKVFSSQPNTAYVPFEGEEVRCFQFYIFICH